MFKVPKFLILLSFLFYIRNSYCPNDYIGQRSGKEELALIRGNFLKKQIEDKVDLVTSLKNQLEASADTLFASGDEKVVVYRIIGDTERFRIETRGGGIIVFAITDNHEARKILGGSYREIHGISGREGGIADFIAKYEKLKIKNDELKRLQNEFASIDNGGFLSGAADASLIYAVPAELGRNLRGMNATYVAGAVLTSIFIGAPLAALISVLKDGLKSRINLNWIFGNSHANKVRDHAACCKIFCGNLKQDIQLFSSESNGLNTALKARFSGVELDDDEKRLSSAVQQTAVSSFEGFSISVKTQIAVNRELIKELKRTKNPRKFNHLGMLLVSMDRTLSRIELLVSQGVNIRELLAEDRLRELKVLSMIGIQTANQIESLIPVIFGVSYKPGVGSSPYSSSSMGSRDLGYMNSYSGN